MDTTVRTPNSFLASNDPTPRAGSYPAWMIKAMEEYAQQKVDLSRKRIEELEAEIEELKKRKSTCANSDHDYQVVRDGFCHLCKSKVLK